MVVLAIRSQAVESSYEYILVLNSEELLCEEAALTLGHASVPETDT